MTAYLSIPASSVSPARPPRARPVAAVVVLTVLVVLTIATRRTSLAPAAGGGIAARRLEASTSILSRPEALIAAAVAGAGPGASREDVVLLLRQAAGIARRATAARQRPAVAVREGKDAMDACVRAIKKCDEDDRDSEFRNCVACCKKFGNNFGRFTKAADACKRYADYWRW